MTVRNLEFLFAPKSIALLGASDRPGSLGATALRNLREAGFGGSLYAVNPKHRELSGLAVYDCIAKAPAPPDLAVICTPPATIPRLIAEAGACGTKAAIVLTGGLRTDDPSGEELNQAMLDAAKPHLLRILGPSCVGLIVPNIGLNASFAHTNALSGNVAFVSQSSAMVSATLDWARSRDIGFSKLISLGDSADVDVGDVIDYLASDDDTRAILLHMESISAVRKFMSAARAAARTKPVLVVRTGRAAEGAKAGASHASERVGSDDVYDAAIRRAGMLRVLTTEELFDTVETLARARPLHGERLAIMSNGGGPAAMAADELSLTQGQPSSLSAETLTNLDASLPTSWSRGNLVDLAGEAPIDQYVRTLQILLRDPGADAILVIHAPTAGVPSVDVAAALTPIVRAARRNILVCWLGGDAVEPARHICAEAGIPTYATPESAVQAFMQIVRYGRNQQLLMEVPSSLAKEVEPDRDAAKKLVRDALVGGRTLLCDPEAKALLAAYGIPVVPTKMAASSDEAVRLAEELGFPVVLKILSPDISSSSDAGGVALNVRTPREVRKAAETMQSAMARAHPDARLQGFAVQTMVQRPDAHQLVAGIAVDPAFGPVILFGQGGTGAEVVADRAVGLPPLNEVLARELISRTRVAKLLAGYKNHAPADRDAIGQTLIQLSRLVADIPELVEIDIDPLLADERGVVAVDARVRIAPTDIAGLSRLCIRPYPEELEEWCAWNGQRILLRPIKPEDSAQHLEFFNALDPEDIRSRTFMPLRELTISQLSRFTQIDFDREMAFIATRQPEPGRSETLAVARCVADPDNERAELAIIVRSDVKRQGLGSVLLKKLIDYARSRGIKELFGSALAENLSVIKLVQRFGFRVSPSRDGWTVPFVLPLQAEFAREPSASIACRP